MTTKERSFSIRDLITALLRDQDIHTGSWGLNIHFMASGANVKQADGAALPGLTVAVSGLTLVPTAHGEDGSLDASLVNPERKNRIRSRAKLKAVH
ncbi:hypothetical protein JFU58_04680 [Pseudomonas sp. TH34]|uniref:hypothetical protein n=1 Tax=Pseudomonas sp. TH34 TaxID=2796399 RepID=UPI0019112B7E|nr:hypothetical protein [Pseudomonas sp. TH34]MBK5407836.1 hypothetical protein [Pseudomonas sp. TH34]